MTLKTSVKPSNQARLKDATLTQLGIKEYWGTWPQANIGIAIPRGYFVLDVDVEHGGFDSLEPLQDKVGILLTLYESRREWRTSPLVQKQTCLSANTVVLGGYPGIDVRGEGGYVVASPSLHRSGNRYEVCEDLPIVVAPERLITLLHQKQIAQQSGCLALKQSLKASETIPLPAFAGSMRRRGMTEAAIEVALQMENRQRCQPPLSEKK